MYRYLFAIAFALSGNTSFGQTSARLDTPDCRRALEVLRAQATAVAASAPSEGHDKRAGRAQFPPFDSLRRQAAVACLGGDTAIRRRTAQPPVAVTTIGVPTLAMPPASHITSLPAKPIDRPTFVTGCDAAGCWANDGSRLQRVGPQSAGPNLFGPRGWCSVQGRVLHCP